MPSPLTPSRRVGWSTHPRFEIFQCELSCDAFQAWTTLITAVATGPDRRRVVRVPVGSWAVAVQQRAACRSSSPPDVGRSGMSPVIRPCLVLSTARNAWWRGLASRSFGPLGLHVEPAYHGLAAHRRAILADLGITRVVEVGANVEPYAGALEGPAMQETSCLLRGEPRSGPSAATGGCWGRRWMIASSALGAEPGSTKLHVTVDSLSTSLLAPTGGPQYALMNEAPDSVVVEVRTLDSFVLTRDKAPTLFKLEVQGYGSRPSRGRHQGRASQETLQRWSRTSRCCRRMSSAAALGRPARSCLSPSSPGPNGPTTDPIARRHRPIDPV